MDKKALEELKYLLKIGSRTEASLSSVERKALEKSGFFKKQEKAVIQITQQAFDDFLEEFQKKDDGRIIFMPPHEEITLIDWKILFFLFLPILICLMYWYYFHVLVPHQVLYENESLNNTMKINELIKDRNELIKDKIYWKEEFQRLVDENKAAKRAFEELQKKNNK